MVVQLVVLEVMQLVVLEVVPIVVVIKVVPQIMMTQDDHSGGRKRRHKRPKTAKKRRFTAEIFILFRHNPSFQITVTVSGRVLLRNDHLFTPYFYTFLE
jgi:hypothetical protein